MARLWTDEHWNTTRLVLGTVLIISTALLVFSAEWINFPSSRSTFWPNESHHGHDVNLASPSIAPQQSGAEITLHPKEHVLRPPQEIKHSWNVTSSRISPDGVSKDVIFINGMFLSLTFHPLRQYDGRPRADEEFCRPVSWSDN